MSTLTLGRLRATGEAFLRALGEARHAELTGRPGHSPRAVRERFAYDLGPDAVDVVLDLAEGAPPDSDDERSARRLLAWLTAMVIDRAVQPINDAIDDWRRRAVVRSGDGHAVPFDAVDTEITRLTDRASRLQLDRARAAAAALDLTPLLIERAQRQRDAVEPLGLAPTLVAAAERVSATGFDSIVTEATVALQAGGAVWMDTIGDTLQKRFSLSLRDARQADLIAALDLSRFDAVFRTSGRDVDLRAIVGSLGLRPDAGGHFHIERTPRGGPVSGAEVVTLQLPSDVRLVLGAVGGVATERLALEALGRALRRVYAEPDAPFEHRWLADPAIEVALGQTLCALLFDEGWLMRASGLSRSEARSLARASATRALFELRRACATHLYHVRVLEEELSEGSREELYIELITGAIGIAPNGIDAALNAPRIPEVGVELRAWQASAVLADELVHRFDVDWYRNPRSGPWLVQSVLAPARGESAAEVMCRAVGRKVSSLPWIDRFERVLAA